MMANAYRNPRRYRLEQREALRKVEKSLRELEHCAQCRSTLAELEQQLTAIREVESQ